MNKSSWVALLIAACLWTVPVVFSLTRVVSVGRQDCRSVQGLAKIERRFVDRQETQSRALLSRGVTFGIPKSQLPRLLQQSQESQAQFLRDLDALAGQSCGG